VTKTALIVSLFALASGAYASTIYQQSGSASLTCGWVGQGPPPNGQFTTHTSVTGTAIDLACPTNSSYAGPSFHGAADPLSVVGNASGAGPNFGGVGVHWDFQSSASDTLVATGGTGSGIVTFTVNWAWNAGDDDCSITTALRFGVRWTVRIISHLHFHTPGQLHLMNLSLMVFRSPGLPMSESQVEAMEL
jgi:hypothetical protein